MEASNYTIIHNEFQQLHILFPPKYNFLVIGSSISLEYFPTTNLQAWVE